MCGRYSVVKSQGEIEGAFDVHLSGFDWAPSLRRYNVAPTQEALVITHEKERREARLFRWGLVPVWDQNRRLINIRDDTLRDKRTFRRNLLHGRCLVVADGFYEWEKISSKRKAPMYIRLEGGQAFALAGLYSRRGAVQVGAPSFSIITTAPNDVVGPIHDRMPVILSPDAADTWLDADLNEESDLGGLLSLLGPFPAAQMEAYEVSKVVNSPSNDGPDCIAPVNGSQSSLL
jgi:putative SOS response-associated peptidase YedK